MGALSGAPRTSDPSSSFKMTTLGQAVGNAKGSSAPAASLGKQGSLYAGRSAGGARRTTAGASSSSTGGWGTRSEGATRGAGTGGMPGLGRGGSVETRRPMMAAAGD